MLSQMNEIEHWRKEARHFSLSDKLGNLLVSMLELMQTVLMNGPRAQALRFKINALSLECAAALKEDSEKDSKLRSLVYGVTASMCALLDGLNERPEKANEDSGMIAEERITQEAAVDNHHDAAAHATAASLASLLAAAANASSSTTSSLNASIGQKRKRNVPAKRTAIAPAAAAVSAPLSTHGSIMKDEIADGTSEFHDDDVNLEMQSDDDVSMEDVIVEVGVREDAAPAREANLPKTERNTPGSSTNAVPVFTAPLLPRLSTRPEEEVVRPLAYLETPHRPKRAVKVELFSEDSADEDAQVMETRNKSKSGRKRLSGVQKKQAKSEKKGSEKDGRSKSSPVRIAAKKKAVKRAAPKYVETEYETEDEEVIMAKKESLQCDHCAKAFISRRKLVTHVRTHTGEKPFKCRECGSAFIERGYLNRHLRNDHGIAPYKCEECDKDYERFLELVHHKKAKH